MMGREIAYLCDGCGADCTEDHFVLEVVHRTGSSLWRYEVGGDAPVLCRSCFSAVDGFLLRTLGGEWEPDEREEL